MQLKYPHDNTLSLGAKPPLVYCFIFLDFLLENLVVFLTDVNTLLAATYI